MYYKYLMENPEDCRGNVALVAMAGSDEIAYTHMEEPTDDMVPLTDGEINLVKEQVKVPWLTQRQRYQQMIDAKADEIRASYMFNGARTIDSEYIQVEAAVRGWEDAGAPEDNVPEEIAVWAEINNQTARWAADDVMTEVIAHRSVIRMVRTLRLRGKAEMRHGASELLEERLSFYLEQLELLRCPVDYLSH